MFEAAKPKPRLEPRPVTIELRDGRRLTGVLHLRRKDTAEAMLRNAMPFLTVKTPQGELAINRDNIAALLLGDEAVQAKPAAPKNDNPKGAFDPCRILQVRPGASPEELKSAWRRRMNEVHPDKLRGRGCSEWLIAAAEDEAAEVNAAYEALSNLRQQQQSA